MNGEDAGCLGTAEPEVPGCTDESANNFNADATSDDGSCQMKDVEMSQH